MRCRRVTPEQVITVEFLLTLTQWNRTHDSKGRSIRLVSIRITLQGEWFRQIILFLLLLPNLSFFQFYWFIVQRSGIIAVHLISQELKKGLHVITYREKFIFLSYFPHLDPASKRNQFRPPRKTDFTHAPYIAADNHIAAHQLVALGTGNETYPVVEIIGIAHHTVYSVFVVFLPVLGKRRQQAFVIQKRRWVDIDTKIFK